MWPRSYRISWSTSNQITLSPARLVEHDQNFVNGKCVAGIESWKRSVVTGQHGQGVGGVADDIGGTIKIR